MRSRLATALLLSTLTLGAIVTGQEQDPCYTAYNEAIRQADRDEADCLSAWYRRAADWWAGRNTCHEDWKVTVTQARSDYFSCKYGR